MSKLRKKNAVYLYSKWYSNVFLATHGRISVAATVCAFLYLCFLNVLGISFLHISAAEGRGQGLANKPEDAGNIWATIFPVLLLISWIYRPRGKNGEPDTARVLSRSTEKYKEGERRLPMTLLLGAIFAVGFCAVMRGVLSWEPLSHLAFCSVPYFTSSRWVNVAFPLPE